MPLLPDPPVGLQLAHTQKAVSRAFAAAIAAAGGSLPTWLVLLALKTRKPATQRELADAVEHPGGDADPPPQRDGGRRADHP